MPPAPPLKVAFLGFSEFERNSLASYFRLASHRAPRYAHTPMLTEAERLVADADHAPSVQLVLATERQDQTVFIGARAPAGSRAWLQRPIDALQVMRHLDALGGTAPVEAIPGVDVVELHDDGTTQGHAACATPGASDVPPVAAAALAARVAAAAPATPPADAPPAAAAGLAARVAAAAPATPAADVPPVAAAAPAARAAAAAPGTIEIAMTSRPAARRPAPASGPPSQPAGLPAAAEPPPRRPAVPPPRALLVDDSDVALRYLQQRLQPWGVQADTAADSSAALELLARRSYQIVFIDVELGDASELDGLALCREIKRSEAAVEAAVVLVSAHHSELDRVHGALAGCDAYLGKPLDEGELRRLLLRQGCRAPVAAVSG